MQENQDQQFDEWFEASGEATESAVTLEQMDQLVVELRELRNDYESKKELAAEAHNILKEKEKVIIQTLVANKRSSYSVDGIGRVGVSIRESFTTPKGNEEKQKLFQYIQSKYGDDALLGLTSINSATLNSWAKSESASGVMVIPGLEAPTATEILSFTRK